MQTFLAHGSRQRSLLKIIERIEIWKQKHISKHIQVESRLSVSGAKADKRIVKTPAEMLQFVKDIEHSLQGKDGHGIALEIAKELKHYKGKSLVVSGVTIWQFKYL